MERFSLDSNIFDRIAESEESADLVRHLIEAGAIQVVATHIQRDELAAIPDAAKRKRIARIPVEEVPTYGFVLDVSRLGEARLGEAAPYEAMTGENRMKYAHDALIAMTARFEGTKLVTEDRRLRRRAESELDIDVWSWWRFREHLDLLST